jgi:hypothetical protein
MPTNQKMEEAAQKIISSPKFEELKKVIRTRWGDEFMDQPLYAFMFGIVLPTYVGSYLQEHFQLPKDENLQGVVLLVIAHATLTEDYDKDQIREAAIGSINGTYHKTAWWQFE